MLAYASRFRFWPLVRSPVVNREGDGRDAFPLVGPRPSPEGSRGLGPMCVHAVIVVTACAVCRAMRSTSPAHLPARAGWCLVRQPCRCLWRGLSQITMTRPCRRITLHLSHMRLTLG